MQVRIYVHTYMHPYVCVGVYICVCVCVCVCMCRWDLIVANFGHHAAAGAEHWTLAEYRAHVDAFLDAIKTRLLVCNVCVSVCLATVAGM
jgi:hypothetical protein